MLKMLLDPMGGIIITTYGWRMMFVLFGVVYPCLAGLDAARQPLYLNLCALGLLVFTAQLLVRRLR